MSILTWFQKWQAYGVVTVSSRSKLSRGEFTRVASNLYSKMNFGKQYLQNHYPWRISQMNLFIDSRVLHLFSLLFCFIAMISFVCHFFEHITVGLVTVFTFFYPYISSHWIFFLLLDDCIKREMVYIKKFRYIFKHKVSSISFCDLFHIYKNTFGQKLVTFQPLDL